MNHLPEGFQKIIIFFPRGSDPTKKIFFYVTCRKVWHYLLDCNVCLKGLASQCLTSSICSQVRYNKYGPLYTPLDVVFLHSF